MKKAFIYKIQNTINGKLYIGSSKRPQKRWYEHKRDLKKGNHHSTHLQNAWNLYGKDNFEFSVIDECDVEIQFTREAEWVIKEQSHLEDWGYNMCIPEAGGGYIHTEEHKAKLREANKIAATEQHRKAREEGKLEVRVYCLINGTYETFPALTDTPYKFKNKCKNFRLAKCKISTYNKTEEDMIVEFLKFQKKYKKFLDSQSSFSIEMIIYKIDKTTLELKNTYNSLNEAVQDNNIKKQEIRDCLSGLKLSAKGYIYTKSLEDVKSIKFNRKRHISFNGTIYKDWKECSASTGLSKAQITLKIRSKLHPTVFWIDREPTKRMLSSGKGGIIPKQVVDQNGILYKSVSEAAKLLNLSTKKIYDVLSGRGKTTKGYSFQYIF